MRTSNPVFTSNAFKTATWDQLADAERRSTTMTVQGTVNAGLILFSLLAAASMGTWYAIEQQLVQPIIPLLGGALGGLVVALIVSFAPKSSPVLAPLYAILEGACLASLSMLVGKSLDAKLGVQGAGATMIFQAIVLTMGVFGGLLIAYTTRLIRASDTFVRCIVAATFGVMIFSLVLLVMRLCGASTSFAFDSSPLSIGISAVIVVIAALNLVLDFRFIEEQAQSGSAPKYMEWYGAFGLLVTLVWLYLEILRLLSKIKER